MSVLNEYVSFLKDYNKLLEKGTKNIYDSTAHIWVDDILQLITEEGCSSIIPNLFQDTIDKVSQILKIDKPLKPVIQIPESFYGTVTFNEAKNIFDSESEDMLNAFKESEEGRIELHKISHFRHAKRIYSKLFNAYNDSKNDSSREVTLSVAFIQYTRNKEKNDIESVTKINQHLFHFPLKLDLLANNAITVSFSEEEKPFVDYSFINNTPIRKEALDNIIDKFESGTEISGFKYIYETEFKNLICDALQQIYVDSSFSYDLKKPKSDQTQLNSFEISFSPAINAKIKKPRFFEKLTDSIIEYDKENKPEVPLINIILKNPNSRFTNTSNKSNYLTDILFEETKEKNANLEKNDFSVFFPLPYNKEQKEIFEKYQKNRLTVVTGPPGTGKSHSIVNILCNLLAQGQRILITAQTDKALESLLYKIPPQFDNLLFTKIKLANSNRFSLEQSIDNLAEILTSEKKVDIEEKIKQLDQFKATYVTLKGNVQSILENEYRVFDLSENFKGLKNHEIFNKLVSVHEVEWKWIEDEVTPEILNQSENIIRSLRSFKSFSENNIENTQSSFEIDSFIKEFDSFDFESYFDLHRRIKDLKKDLLLSTAATNDQITSLTIDSIKPLLIEYDNSDIIIKESQTLHRLYNYYKPIEVNEDIKTNIYQSELLKERNTYIKDIQDYVTLIPKDKTKLSFFQKIGSSKYKRLKYLEAITLNEQRCVNKLTLVNLEKYIQDLYSLDLKVKEIEKYSFKNKFSDGLSLNDKIASYNELIKSIVTNKNIIELIENNSDLKNLIEIFDLYPFDIKAAYNKSNQIQSKFKKLQALILELDPLIKKADDLNDKLSRSDVREYFRNYLPVFKPDNENVIEEVKSLLINLSNKIWANRNFKKSEILLKSLIPNTFRNIDKLDERYLHSEAFEFSYAFNHLNKNALLDFQSIKEKLKFYFDKITETKSDILFELAKSKFQNKFQPAEVEDFLNILHNYKYNLSQASRGIQQNAKFKSLVRKNSVAISNRLSCWVMKFSDVLNALGNEPEVFDCIIVDEASQLDFNSVLLSYYAKNMIIVGDDKQTSPSGLSGVGQEELGSIIDKNLIFMGDEKVHIRNDNSLFSLTKMVAGSSNLSLKEHFRSAPEIIAFSKDQFYPNSLRPLKQLNSNRLSPKILFFVPDAYLENKIVIREIEDIKRYIIGLFNDPIYDEKTIGVVSLGSADHTEKLSLITEELYELFSKEKIEKHNLIIADAAKFQGDERDVMIVSLGVALDIQKLSQNEEAKPYRIVNDKKNLTDSLKSINVALSRAKEQMTLFYSLKPDQLKPGDFRIDIINFFKEAYSSIPEIILPPNISSSNRTRENVPIPFDSWFEYDIADILIQKGYLFIKPQYEVKEKELFNNPRTGEITYVHFKLDLVIFSNGKSVAIECDGDPFHSSSEDVAYDVERQEFLERVGWKIYRILYSLFKKDPTLEINKLVEFIQRHTK